MTNPRISALFRPASVVLVGASETPGTLGDVARRNLREAGFGGPVHYVNPAHASIDGQVVHRSVLDLPVVPELALIVAPASAAAGIVTDCGEKGVRAAIVVSAGPGVAGDDLERDLARRARRHGLRLLGPASLGVMRSDIALNASCGPRLPLAGRLALVSQSASICAAILDWARPRQIGFSTVVSTGRGLDLDVGDLLDYLANDPATDSIMLYVDAIAGARRVISALRAAARVKPVVVMKAGRHAGTPRAASLPHGPTVGADDVFDAAMRRAGVLRIRDFSELYTAAATLGAGVRVDGRRLAIVSNAAGPAALAADRAQERALSLARLEAWPIHVCGEDDAGRFAAVAQASVEDPGVDVLLAIFVPHPLIDADAIAAAIAGIKARTRKAVFACWMGGETVAAGRQRLAAARVPTYQRPETAVDAIAALALYAANQQQLLQVPEPLAAASAPDRDRAQAVVDTAISGGREWLDPVECKAVLDAFSVVVVPGRIARSAAEATRIAHDIGLPVAMKIVSRDIVRKTDVGGVRLGVSSARAVRDAYRAMLEDVARTRPEARLDGILIEAMHQPRHGREVRIGTARDPVFGPAISFGLGGLLVEVLGDRAVALPPLNAFLAGELVRRTRAGQALQALHGAPAADASAVEEVLLRVSELVCELPAIHSIDLDPVVVTASGAVVLDARIGIRAPPPASRPYEHMAIHPYPSGLREPIVLRGGEVATIRPIRPEDAAIEAAFVHGLSEQSKFLRFMFGMRDLSPQMLSRFTQIDYDRELALIAVITVPGGEQQIGVARYTTLPLEETCEFAIVIGDAWQGQGLGRRLLGRLIDAARSRGLQAMCGVTLRENARMLELARSLGFSIRPDPEDADLMQMTLRL